MIEEISGMHIYIYGAMATRAESRIATTITTGDNDDDETAVVDIAR